MDPVFSRPGEAPTDFERQLLDCADVSHPSTTRELWLLLAKRAGLDALLMMLDEFGDGHVWVPSRRAFFNLFGRRQALEDIVASMLDQDISQRDIAQLARISHTQVQRIAARHAARRRGTCAHGSAPATREKQRG